MSKHRGYHHQLTIRATKTERKHLGERAKAAQLSISRYLIETGLTSANPPTPESRAERERLVFQLRKVGVNLNQLARRANAGLPVPLERLERTLNATAAIMDQLQGGAS
ncbi:MAG: plasmid mobilization protein [Chloroflexota bacterium]